MLPQNYEYLILVTTNYGAKTKEPVRICTKYFNRNIDQVQENIQKASSFENSFSSRQKFYLMEMYIYSQADVYFSSVAPRNLNAQLNWNNKFIEFMKKLLNCQNKNCIVELNTVTDRLKISSQFNDSQFRITLFETDIINLHKNPYKHSKQMLNIIHSFQSDKLSKLKASQSIFNKNRQSIQILHKQMVDQNDCQMNHIKDQFIKIVNDTKKKLRPHFGIEDKKQNGEGEEDQSNTQTRTIFRLKSHQNRPSQNIFNLFD